LRGSGGGDRRRQGRVLRTLDWQTAPRAWPEDGGGFSLSPGERAGVRGLLSRFNRHSEFPMVRRSQRNFLRRFPEQPFQISDKPVHIFLRRVPRAHQTAATLTDERVKFPARLPQRDDHVRRQIGEHGVGLRWEEDSYFGYFLQRVQ